MKKPPHEIHVAVLYGGISDEREVSLSSGTQVHQALLTGGFQTQLIDTRDSVQTLCSLMETPYDVAFIALHGKGGEDGTIQGVLESLGLPYTGSKVLASALAMDKTYSRVVYANAGLPVAPGIALHCTDKPDFDALIQALGEQCVVKPASGGSSVGMSIVHNAHELPAAITQAFEYDTKILVERYIPGKEATCAVLGNDVPQALPVIEIVPHTEFYDYRQKYSASGADHVIPARFDAQTLELIQDYALRAHKALGCRGVSRTDFIVAGPADVFLLETNTVPGLTATSLLPDAARHAGYSFEELCARMVYLALE